MNRRQPPTFATLTLAAPSLATLVLALTPILILALLAPAPTTRAADVTDIDTAQSLLREGDHAGALEVTRELLDDLAPRVVASGTQAEYLVGTLHTLHALAHSGLGDEDTARWHWYFAQSLSEQVARTSLADYGEAGAYLERFRIHGGEGGAKCFAEAARTDNRTMDGRRLGDDIDVSEGLSGGAGVAKGSRDAADREALVVAGDVTPPVKVHAPFPVYPVAMREAGLTGTVVLQGIVDREGRLHDLCLLKAPSPGLAHQAAEVLREWRFEPATLNGEPVPAFYNLTVSFTMK